MNRKKKTRKGDKGRVTKIRKGKEKGKLCIQS